MSALKRFGASKDSSKPRNAMQSDGGGKLIRTIQELEEVISGGAETKSGARVTPETAMRVAAVFACVRIRSSVVANLPLQIKRRVDDDTRKNAFDHPLWTIFTKRPNRWQTPSQFKRMLEAHLLLRGNAFAKIIRGVRGDVQELIPLHPDRVTTRQLDDLSIVYEYQRRDGRTIPFGQSDVFHLVGLSLDGVTGVSVIKYARETIGLAIAQEEHGASVFKNGARVSFVLKHPQSLGEEGVETLRKSLNAFRAGGENEGEALILEEGMSTEALAMTAEDAQWLESRKFSRTDIAMFFGVPPHMIGDTEKSTSWGTGLEQQTQGFKTFSAEDDFTTWEETVNRDLISDDEPDLYARFNRNALVQGDMKARKEYFTSMLQWGVFSPNEVRKLEDMNPREDGNIYYPPPNTAGTLANKEGEGRESADAT
ncbi:phage portal protein [Roseibium sp. TrichSKD4]|uniref:phage portal protein n=1 Tax=Roseibium sp. TrichSKD4 TaxID=744980 RepID=UPI001FFC7C30|nr:phage portal protein [Roseibium sp. TrichSKD4]